MIHVGRPRRSQVRRLTTTPQRTGQKASSRGTRLYTTEAEVRRILWSSGKVPATSPCNGDGAPRAASFPKTDLRRLFAMMAWWGMPRSCVISFTDSDWIRRSVEVAAESLYEACGYGRRGVPPARLGGRSGTRNQHAARHQCKAARNVARSQPPAVGKVGCQHAEESQR